MLSKQGAQVQSLVEELISHMLHSVAKKQTNLCELGLLGIPAPKASLESTKPLQLTSSLQEIQGVG